MTLLYSDPLFLLHETGRHPECADRLRAVTQRLHESGLLAECRSGTFGPATDKDIVRVHAPHVLERLNDLVEQGGGMADADTVVSPASVDVARAAAGACLAAVEAVIAGVDINALCLIRPPGHHATSHHSMGFCLFNSIAIAAASALARHQLNRILIVDWDVHHGNGTQEIFYADGRVCFLSIHRYGYGFYPGTGAANETGSGAGLGLIRNVPMPYGVRRSDYHGAFRNAVEEAADRIKPELVLVSAGFDAHRDDPIGSLGLDSEDFATLTDVVLGVARTHSQGRLVSCLEGGYNLDALAESAKFHLSRLLGKAG